MKHKADRSTKERSKLCATRMTKAEMIIILFLFLAMPHGRQDFSSPTRGRTHAPCIGNTWVWNHWNTREVPEGIIIHEQALGKIQKGFMKRINIKRQKRKLITSIKQGFKKENVKLYNLILLKTYKKVC